MKANKNKKNPTPSASVRFRPPPPSFEQRECSQSAAREPIRFTLSVCPQVIQGGNRIGRSKAGKAFIFSSKQKSGYQLLVQAEASRHRPRTPLTGPIRLDLIFVLPRPQSLMRKCDPDGMIPHTKRPDRDNLIKGTQDGLSAAGFWLDDSQIFAGDTAKCYAEKHGQPRIIVRIEEVAP